MEKITREEALKISKETLETAEQERNSCSSCAESAEDEAFTALVSEEIYNPIIKCGDEEIFAEDMAIIYLMSKGVLIPLNALSSENKKTIGLYVNCSDTFVWACSDCEEIESSERIGSNLHSLYMEVRKNAIYGSTIWVCKKRNEQPMIELKRRMIDKGVWTEELEALPENKYSAWCRMKKEEE